MTNNTQTDKSLFNYDHKFSIQQREELSGEPILLHYVPVSEAHAMLWDQNPKSHDFESLMRSIVDNGFADPPKYDATLDALVAGNGRTTALNMMELSGDYNLPRGILLNDNGNWVMPVLFGLDAASQAAAKRYALDHNNLTMAGGDFTLYDVARLWDRDKYLEVLEGLNASGDNPITVSAEDFEVLSSGFSFDDYDDIDLDDDTEEEDDDDLADEPEGTLLKVFVRNSVVFDDVVNSVAALLDDNPGWDAEVLLDD